MESGASWMNIFQNARKIGYTHRKLETVDGGYRVYEKTVMKINSMGLTQEITVISLSKTDRDFAIRDFNFSIISGSFDFALRGVIEGDVLYIHSGKTDAPKPMEIKLENRPYLSSGLIQAAMASGMEPGSEMVLFVFDPSTLGQAPATIKMLERETISIGEQDISARKLSLSFKNVKQSAWVDDYGQVLKEQGMLGITLIKTDRESALQGIPIDGSEDLTELVSVPSNIQFKDTERLSELKIRISAIEQHEDADNRNHSEQHMIDTAALSRGRQTMKDGILTIRRESLEDLPRLLTPEDLAGVDEKYKIAAPFIQSDDHRIRQIARRVVETTDTPLEKVEKLVRWIQENIRRQPVVSLPNALSTVKNRVGDCNEHAALMAAFCRALGIPAGIEAGLVYLRGRFYYHAWNRVYLGKWITVDALFNQIPSDVTHIALTSGSQETQLDLMGVIGNVRLEVLSYQ